MISHDKLAEFSAVLWPSLADHLWQATIIAGICLLALPAFRNAGARARFFLWALAFMSFAIPQSLVSFLADHLGLRLSIDSGFGPQMQQVSDTMVQVTQPSVLVAPRPGAIGSMTALHSEIYCILTVLWIAGCSFLLIRWWFRQYRFSKSLRMSNREFGNEFMHTLESLSSRLGIRRRAKLRVVWQGSEPGVYGVWRPVLVLPEEMPRQLSPAEAEAVLAHELVHVVRWDNLWSNLQMVVCCIFWFYPVIWLLDRRLIAEREHSCDERVIEVLRNSQAYASGLIKMTSIGLGLRTAGVSPMAGANLKRRIENMKNTTGKTGWGVWILLSSITALAVFLYLAAGCRPATASNLTIENPDESPLKIESAYVENILMPSKGTVEKLPRFVNPKIVLKNNSGRAIAVYELEFQKAGSDSIFLVNTQAGLAPNAVDTIDAITIERKTTNMYIAPPSSAKPTGDGERWTVHVVVMRFSDGSVLTLHTIPIPPPMNSPPLETMPVSQQLPTMQPVTVLPLPDKPLIRAGGKSMESKLIYRVAIYPPQAVKEGITGKVVLQVKIDEKGQVRNAQVIRSAHPILDEAAIAAVKQWRYSATMLNGVPVPVESTVTVEFPQK